MLEIFQLLWRKFHTTCDNTHH